MTSPGLPDEITIFPWEKPWLSRCPGVSDRASGRLRWLADAGRSAGVEDELRRHRQDAPVAVALGAVQWRPFGAAQPVGWGM